MINYLKLFRLPLVFTAVADSAAGYILAMRGESPDPRVLGLLALASGGLYCFGMAMNDIADRKRDIDLYPDRVLPSGRISLRSAVIASLAVLALSAGSIVGVPGASLYRLVSWGMVVLFILAYDFSLKWPPVMGLIRALNFSLGTLSVPSPMPDGLPFAAALFVYVAALTFVSTLEEGKIRKPLLLTGATFMALCAAVPPMAAALARPEHYDPRGWAASGFLVSWILLRAVRAADRKGVMLLVRDGVAGIILLDASMLLSAGLPAPGLLVASLLIPAAAGIALFKRFA